MFFKKQEGRIRFFKNKNFLGVLVFLLFFSLLAKAEDDFEDRVIINEVAWMGTEKSSSDEWIELRNLSDEKIDLEGWTLESVAGSDLIRNKDESKEQDKDKNKINLKGEIKAGGFYLLERSDDNSVELVDADLIFVGSINDTEESLILKNEKGEIIDEIRNEKKWPAGVNDKGKPKRTMERTDEDEWQDSFKEGGTPGEKNSKESDGENNAEDEDEKDDEDESDENEKDDQNEDADGKSEGDGESQENEDKSKCNIKDRAGLDEILINEILPDPSEGGEWIELYNFGKEDVLLEGCFLMDENLYEKNDFNQYSEFKKDQEIKSGEYKIVFNQTKNEINKAFVINNSNEKIYFLDERGLILNKLFFKEKAEKDFSYALNSKREWQWVESPTPGAVNKFPEPKIYSKKIEITEILPNPEGVDKDKEWVELFNGDQEKLDLENWYLINQSDDQKFKLDGFKIDFQKRIKVEIKNSSFSVKNSDGWIELRNPNDEMVDRVNYLESAKINTSYNKRFDGKWEWSIFITPGEENKFNHPPTYRVDIPDKIYENVKAVFKIEKVNDKDGEDLKFRWDFGDGKKSYLQNTSYKFDKRGRYTIETRVSDLSADVFKSFSVKVIKFPDFKLKIVKLLPNPKGSDSENEKIWIINKEKKTVNLKGWVIATGSEKDKLINHYFKDDFKIKAGELKEIYRHDCPFSLLNKKGRVVLKAPNGKIIDEIEYEKDKINDDEIYYLEDGEWFWESPVTVAGEQQVNSSFFVDQTESQKNLEIEKNNLLRSIFDEEIYNSSDKLIYFNNWLFVQSQEYFFEFIFPDIFLKRVDSWKSN